MADLTNFDNNFDFQQPTFDNNSPVNTFASYPYIEDQLNEAQYEKLHILAQPKQYYRGRYPSEIDQLKNRAKRFIRAEDNEQNYEYPTIQIPTKWCQSNQSLFIRVTLVTVISAHVPHHCIHPYEIDSIEENVIKDNYHNTLYFPIHENEYFLGEKSFRIIVKKLKRDDLKTYGSLRLFDAEKYTNMHIDTPTDAKQMISLYQLEKSQFVFTLALKYEINDIFIPMYHTSICSQIMIDGINDERNALTYDRIKCIPEKSNWQGGDEIVLVMPKPIKGQMYSIYFDFGLYGKQIALGLVRIDTRVILLRTPPCPLLSDHENYTTRIIVRENDSVIGEINFQYVSPMKTTRTICSNCLYSLEDMHLNNKRRYIDTAHFETDGGDQLISQMKQLSIEQKPAQSDNIIISHENDSRFEKYINQLKIAIEKFVRTNDPSKLFRRTRLLLSYSNESPPPLIDAIQRGHTQLAQSLIEQTLDMDSSYGLLEKVDENGQTALLIAAKSKQWNLIEPILKSRLDLVCQSDNDGNNLLHLLADLKHDSGIKIIKSVCNILPNPLKTDLIKRRNKNNHTPLKIAQYRGNHNVYQFLLHNTNKTG